MKVIKLALSMIIVAMVQLPIFAEEQGNQAQIDGLRATMADGDTVAVRGSAMSKKALGLYGRKDPVIYRSGYEKLSSKDQAEWAYDLHEFVVSKGGGFENVVKYAKENQEKGRKQPLFNSYGSDTKPDPFDPDTRAQVSYADQKKFAQDWWTAKDQGYKAAAMKDWWLNDAILDGTNLWNQFEAKTEHGADRQAWRDTELSRLVNKK